MRPLVLIIAAIVVVVVIILITLFALRPTRPRPRPPPRPVVRSVPVKPLPVSPPPIPEAKRNPVPIEVITTEIPATPHIVAYGTYTIRIEKAEEGPRGLNVLELYATDADGKSVLAGATITASSPAIAEAPYKNLIDGDEITSAQNTPTEEEWIEIKLAEPKYVRKIEVVLPADYANRSAIRITTFNGEGNMNFTTGQINNVETRHKFDIRIYD